MTSLAWLLHDGNTTKAPALLCFQSYECFWGSKEHIDTDLIITKPARLVGTPEGGKGSQSQVSKEGAGPPSAEKCPKLSLAWHTTSTPVSMYQGA